MDVIQERLEREYDLDLIATAPSVIYNVTLTSGEEIQIDNPAELPDPQKIREIQEPYVRINLMTPDQYVGDLMQLCQDKRGTYINLEHNDATRRTLIYEMPLNEIVFDFFNKLKSISRGYASFDYELIGYKPSKLVKMDILLNGQQIDALSFIVHKDFAYERGKVLAEKLKELIPRQNYEVPVQAVIGGKVIARTTIKAYRKDVL
ncbi:hypothetical protein Zmor_011794 [Zophobas morio]|uniref:Elongation factor EFG domain-containing protein n=1 Tax=Zophobas morio TaxID=2755281 RepID=A0AA38LYR1_9CUCU|nr:hypothetical protein Zmor_011794 [Zophobas morio]